MLFQHIQEEHKLYRIQASVSVLDLTANRYAQWLGFQKEGIMKKYGPDGTDYVRYARLM
jgi:RimJ/RimL family protein N-acetyltransferase